MIILKLLTWGHIESNQIMIAREIIRKQFQICINTFSLLSLAPVLHASNPERNGKEFCLGVPTNTYTQREHTHTLKRVSSTLAYLFGSGPQKIGIDCSLFLYIFWTATETQNNQRICHFCESQLKKQVFKHLPPCITIRHRHLASFCPWAKLGQLSQFNG